MEITLLNIVGYIKPPVLNQRKKLRLLPASGAFLNRDRGKVPSIDRSVGRDAPLTQDRRAVTVTWHTLH